MAATGPSVFLLMVNGQVESAQVSGRGPRRGPTPTLPWGPAPQPPGLLCSPKEAYYNLGWGGGLGREPAFEKLGASLLGVFNPDVRGVETDLEGLS